MARAVVPGHIHRYVLKSEREALAKGEIGPEEVTTWLIAQPELRMNSALENMATKVDIPQEAVVSNHGNVTLETLRMLLRGAENWCYTDPEDGQTKEVPWLTPNNRQVCRCAVAQIPTNETQMWIVPEDRHEIAEAATNYSVLTGEDDKNSQ